MTKKELEAALVQIRKQNNKYLDEIHEISTELDATKLRLEYAIGEQEYLLRDLHMHFRVIFLMCSGNEPVQFIANRAMEDIVSMVIGGIK